MTWQAGAVAALAAGSVAVPRVASAQVLPPAIEFFVANAPSVATGDKGSFLVYELTVTNLTGGTVALRRVEALDADRGGLYHNPLRFTEGSAPAPGGAALANLAGAELLGDIAHPAGAPPAAGRGAAGAAGRGAAPAGPPADAGQLGAGSRLYVYVLVNVDGSHPPARLIHRLTFQRADSTTFMLEGAPIPVGRSVVAIGPPFRTGTGGIEWVAVNGPGNISGHRRYIGQYDGRSTVGQRFAIDYLMVDATGSTRRPGSEQAKNDSYYAFGQELLAVADGVITATKDSIPTNVPVGGRSVAIDAVTLGGNFVAIKIANETYALYAHVQPGTLRVKVGDKVKRGQVIALLGNSGNSTEAHVHFQISSGPSFVIDSEGMPYTTDFTILGDCAGLNRPCTPRTPPTTVKGIPLQNEIVRFPK
jgi:hypothetical protein